MVQECLFFQDVTRNLSACILVPKVNKVCLYPPRDNLVGILKLTVDEDMRVEVAVKSQAAKADAEAILSRVHPHIPLICRSKVHIR